MSASSKVVWSEGLFLQPQHFQQQDRYFERYIELRCAPLVSHSWGLTEIDVDPGLLGLGKFAVRRAAGVFPDGTPIRMPAEDPLPDPIDVPDNARDQILYLALPVRREGSAESVRVAGGETLVRHSVTEVQAHDASASGGGTATLEVGALRTRILLAADVTPAYACVPIAQLVERRSDGQVVLDDKFIPTVLHDRAATQLAGFAKRLHGQLRQCGDLHAGRVTATGRGGAAEIASFLKLQAINRYEPLVAYISECGAHPADLYRVCAMLAGELATFTPSKRPAPFPPYRHDRLRESFEPVIAAIDFALQQGPVDLAISLPIERKQYGIWLARVADRTLFNSATFVLGVRGDVSSEEVRKRVPAQLKVGAPERIQEIVTRALRGVPVQPVPTAPREIPFHTGFVYFELDQTHEAWKEVKTAGAIAMFPGEFPGLAMELWAIRG